MNDSINNRVTRGMRRDIAKTIGTRRNNRQHRMLNEAAKEKAAAA